MAPAAVADEPCRRAIAGRACTVAGSLAAEAAAGYWHPALGAALALADVIIPAIIVLILLIAILRGSTETCERTFRVLRWIAGRPAARPSPCYEPAARTRTVDHGTPPRRSVTGYTQETITLPGPNGRPCWHSSG